MTALSAYLEKTREVHTSGVGVKEASYYPALDTLFNAIGSTLTPRVVAISGVADQGGKHPDHLLQVEATRDLRASVEVKAPTLPLEQLMQSEQVRGYLTFYHLCLITNLRDFALVRLTPHGAIEEIMRYTLAPDDRSFWRTPLPVLVERHDEQFSDFLKNVLTWDAEITRPRELANALARYARETLRRLERQPAANLAPLREALSEALGLRFTDDEGEHFFRSSLVQTLFYGLFSAWVVWARGSASPSDFRWREAGDYLSLPVMRELFERVAIPNQLESLNLRRPIEWAEATLRRTQWVIFSTAFDQGDAVNYFYEPFLEAYDPQLREQLGVWYTPREIITYQVARVHRLLREELGIAEGLASEHVIVLDPATGTGGYLLEVLRVINATLAQSAAGGLRRLMLQRAATQRIFGFEILPAPFVVAHLQIATLLAALDAPLAPQQRAGVYLTNALTGWKPDDDIAQMSLPAGFAALQQEAQAATNVKRESKILVILGNPPYYGFAGVAEDEEHDLIAPYYLGLKERFGVQPRGLNDLYVRFLRLAERQIAETTGRGVVSVITNYNWLHGLSHAIMREHMVHTFDTIWIDSLNGDKYATGKRTPWGTPDQSIFTTESDARGIQIGAAITTMALTTKRGDAAVFWRQFWGKASEKRTALIEALQQQNISGGYEQLYPNESTRFTLAPGGSESEYPTWPALDELFVHLYPGTLTSRDSDLVSIDRQPLLERMRRYYDPKVDDSQIAEIAPSLMIDTNRFPAKSIRNHLLKNSMFNEEHIIPVCYRPFDTRFLYWEGEAKLLDERREDFFGQVFTGNLFLEAVRRQRKSNQFDHGVVLPHFMDYNYADGGARCFPLYARQTQSLFAQTHPNFHDAILAHLAQTYGEDERVPELFFYHIAAILNTPLYRSENAGSIEQDWPRIPLPATRAALEASAALGQQVSDLLRPDAPFTPPPEQRPLAAPTRSDGGQLSADDLRVTIRYGGVGKYQPPTPHTPARLWWNDHAYWNNVPPEVWAFTIGGYPVIKKWLDYRHESKLGRSLRPEEILYVQQMAQRIATLLALGPTLDTNYTTIKAHTLPPPTPAPSTWKA